MTLRIVLALGVLIAASPAWAQDRATAVMLPPRLEPGVTEGIGVRASSALRRLLEDEGQYTTYPPDQVIALADADQLDKFQKPKYDGDLSNCNEVECALWFKSIINADLATQLTVFNALDPTTKRLRANSLTVILIETAEAKYVGSAELKDNKIEAAIAVAWAEARKKQQKGVGPWLSVVGSPEGARISMDERWLGELPLTRTKIVKGLHVLTVREDGYAERTQTFSIDDISTEKVITVELEKLGKAPIVAVPEDKDSEKTPPPEAAPAKRQWPSRSTLDWVVGGTVFAAGAVYAIAGGIAYSREGDCTKRETIGDERVCTSRVDPDGLTLTKVVGGSAAALLGVGIAVWGPIGLYGSGNRDSAHLSMHGKF